MPTVDEKIDLLNVYENGACHDYTYSRTHTEDQSVISFSVRPNATKYLSAHGLYVTSISLVSFCYHDTGLLANMKMFSRTWLKLCFGKGRCSSFV